MSATAGPEGALGEAEASELAPGVVPASRAAADEARRQQLQTHRLLSPQPGDCELPCLFVHLQGTVGKVTSAPETGKPTSGLGANDPATGQRPGRAEAARTSPDQPAADPAARIAATRSQI